MCTMPARASPRDSPNSAPRCRPEWPPRSSRRWSRAPWTCLKWACFQATVDAYTLRDTADWVIKPRLLAVPGVAHVIVFGGDVRQIQILPDTRKLSSFGVTFTDVSDAAKAALPLRGAGFVDTEAQRILLKSPDPHP